MNNRNRAYEYDLLRIIITDTVHYVERSAHDSLMVLLCAPAILR